MLMRQRSSQGGRIVPRISSCRRRSSPRRPTTRSRIGSLRSKQAASRVSYEIKANLRPLTFALPPVSIPGSGTRSGVDTEFSAGSVSHDPLQGVNQNVGRRDPGSPQNCDGGAAQRRGGKRNGWPGTFANLNPAGFRPYGAKFLSCERPQNYFGRTSPDVIDHYLEA